MCRLNLDLNHLELLGTDIFIPDHYTINIIPHIWSSRVFPDFLEPH